jgi:tetratricopeptide (TPR) repeat protein
MKLKILVLILFAVAISGLFMSRTCSSKSEYAISIWLESLKIMKNHRDITAFYNRATLYNECNHVERVIQDLTTIISIYESNIETSSKLTDLDFVKGAYLKLGNIFIFSSQKDKAITNYKRYIELLVKEPENDFMFQLSFMEVKNRDPQLYKDLVQYKNNLLKH